MLRRLTAGRRASSSAPARGSGRRPTGQRIAVRGPARQRAGAAEPRTTGAPCQCDVRPERAPLDRQSQVNQCSGQRRVQREQCVRRLGHRCHHQAVWPVHRLAQLQAQPRRRQPETGRQLRQLCRIDVAEEVQRQVQLHIGDRRRAGRPRNGIASCGQCGAQRRARPQRDEQPQRRHRASSAATCSASASAEVRPGDSMPNRFTSPDTPCVAGPSMRKSCAGSPGPRIFGRTPT